MSISEKNLASSGKPEIGDLSWSDRVMLEDLDKPIDWEKLRRDREITDRMAAEYRRKQAQKQK